MHARPGPVGTSAGDDEQEGGAAPQRTLRISIGASVAATSSGVSDLSAYRTEAVANEGTSRISLCQLALENFLKEFYPI